VDKNRTHTDIPRFWIVVVLIVWAVGLYQSTISTDDHTATGDRYHDIPTYEPARGILKDKVAADYLTDFGKWKKTHNRYWRAQYATVPTVLQIRYTAEEADDSARETLEQGRRYCRILEFKSKKTLRASRRSLAKISDEFGALVEEHALSTTVVVFSVSRSADD